MSMPPGNTSVIEIRFLDTLIGSAISLLAVSNIIVGIGQSQLPYGKYRSSTKARTI
jgi:hypothetical protein